MNILLTSTCWRNDHNGFSHQGPGFLDALIGKRGTVVRAYLPPDANCLLVTAEHCWNTQNRVNIIVQVRSDYTYPSHLHGITVLAAYNLCVLCVGFYFSFSSVFFSQDKQVQLQYLNLDEARAHFKAGISRWAFASNDEEGKEPDVVIASCGDVLTMEALAATQFLREQCPGLRIRFINIIDMMRVAVPTLHPHGMPAKEFDAIFPPQAEVIVGFHSYPAAFHQLVHNRPNPSRFHVRGYSVSFLHTTTIMIMQSHCHCLHPSC